MTAEVEVRRGSAADVEALRPLWVSMVEHHRQVAGDEWPVRGADAAWRIREAQYRGWLADGSRTLFVASAGDPTRPVGYAMLQVHEPGATWDLGRRWGRWSRWWW